MNAQLRPVFSAFPALPDTEGMAGMFAGKSNGRLFCMGGANFPDKKPWEGGKKVWYDDIYMLNEKNQWIKLKQKLQSPLAYGISVEFNNELILVGGNDEANFHAEVFGLKWNGTDLVRKDYPSLPVPLASMAGALVGNLIIVAGGASGFTSPSLEVSYALDLTDPGKGWFSLPSYPGPARSQSVAGSYKGSFFLFSGEAAVVEINGLKQRKILRDAYRFTPVKKNGTWTGTWELLGTMPRGVSASANPVPVIDGEFIFWGGVDAEATASKDPKVHPGLSKRVFVYNAETKVWTYAGVEEKFQSRVTLPAVLWKNQWLYISGEIRAGVRTPSMVAVSK